MLGRSHDLIEIEIFLHKKADSGNTHSVIQALKKSDQNIKLRLHLELSMWTG